MAKKKYIETPEKMWSLFLEYKNAIKSNPIMTVEQKKGNTILPKDFAGKLPDPVINLPLQRPLTIEGFENYVADLRIISDLSQYFANTESRYNDYQTICLRIKRTIRQDQIEGGMCGIYNPSITQRLNNLTEKTDITTDGQPFGDYNITLNLSETNIKQAVINSGSILQIPENQT